MSLSSPLTAWKCPLILPHPLKIPSYPSGLSPLGKKTVLYFSSELLHSPLVHGSREAVVPSLLQSCKTSYISVQPSLLPFLLFCKSSFISVTSLGIFSSHSSLKWQYSFHSLVWQLFIAFSSAVALLKCSFHHSHCQNFLIFCHSMCQSILSPFTVKKSSFHPSIPKHPFLSPITAKTSFVSPFTLS